MSCVKHLATSTVVISYIKQFQKQWDRCLQMYSDMLTTKLNNSSPGLGPSSQYGRAYPSDNVDIFRSCYNQLKLGNPNSSIVVN